MGKKVKITSDFDYNKTKDRLDLLIDNLFENISVSIMINVPNYLIHFSTNNQILKKIAQKESIKILNRLTNEEMTEIKFFEFLSKKVGDIAWVNYLKNKYRIPQKNVKEASELLENLTQEMFDKKLDKLIEFVASDKNKDFIRKYWHNIASENANPLLKNILNISKAGYKVTKNHGINRFNISNDFVSVAVARNDEEILNTEFKIKEHQNILINNTLNFISSFDCLDNIILAEKTYEKACNFYKKAMKEQLSSKSLIEKYRNIFINNLNFRLDFRENIICLNKYQIKFSDIDDDFLKNIEEEIKNQYNSAIEIYIKDKKRLQENIEKLSKKPEIIPILEIINKHPKKGITTYINILKGSKNKKMQEEGFVKESAYGALKNLNNNKIENLIDELVYSDFLEKRSLKASFGYYDGYIITQDGYLLKNSIKVKAKVDDVDVQINTEQKNRNITLNELLKEMQNSLDEEKLLNTVVIKEADAIDIDSIIKFIGPNRDKYRKFENLFISKISLCIPEKFAPIFLLNSKIKSGVEAKTFEGIYNAILNRNTIIS